jgi:hypothetical protein
MSNKILFRHSCSQSVVGASLYRMADQRVREMSLPVRQHRETLETRCVFVLIYLVQNERHTTAAC